MRKRIPFFVEFESGLSVVGGDHIQLWFRLKVEVFFNKMMVM